MEKRLFTSESVTEGHPDKICDQVSDAVLDALLEQDPYSRVACETCTNTGFVLVMGEITTKAKDCDGFIFASPVYYAHPSARLLAVLDRAFYSNKSVFVYKPGACIFSARRAGQVASMDVVNKHFSISHMPIVSANYWNEVFGSEPEDVYKDAEGVATMQNIAKNMSWLLKSIEAGKKAGLERPELSTGHTNFHH